MAGEVKQFVIYQDITGEWRWTLYAPNARKIADSAESYQNRNDCIQGARMVAAISSAAPIWDGISKQWV